MTTLSKSLPGRPPLRTLITSGQRSRELPFIAQSDTAMVNFHVVAPESILQNVKSHLYKIFVIADS